MKSRRLISFLLVALLIVSTLSAAASAYEADIAESGYYNQNYLENYAAKAYDEEGLGCTYTPTATTFKVWAPEAKGVSVKLFTTGTDAESGAAVKGVEEMTYNSTSGVWSVTLQGDYKNTYYTYIVNREGSGLIETQDPYATAAGANGNRSMVCDLDSTDPAGWDDDQHVFFDNPGEAVVWEIHVRDFSIDVSSGVSDANKGKYLAFTEGDTTVNGEGKVASCVDYLVEHNVNAVQLMPIEDFASIDETDDAIKRNWGYDPKNYNVPEGSYSSNPYDGNIRIKEFKMLVQALHDRGIAVIMDVVYNHTFVREGSPFNLTTPGYWYRKSSAQNYHNGSGLGNVLASEKKMVSKFISESLNYWVEEYHIDGFRFDLMGCFDIPNMKIWRSNLDKIDRRILMYGEPWPGGDTGISNAINKGNISQLDRVGGFNEGYSDSLKGNHEQAMASSGGFLNGGSDSEILKAAAGQASDFPGAKLNQFINYTDNHDNLTIFDKLLATNNTAGYVTGKDGVTNPGQQDLYAKNKNAVNNPSDTVKKQMKLALTATLTSQGIPFTVAGTEFCRTKYGDANSYRTPDQINAIDWTRAAAYADIANYYAGLIAIRKAFNAFTDNTANSITSISGCTAWKITNSASGQWNNVIVALNNSGSAKSISLSGSWTVVANGSKAGTVSLGTASGSYSVPAYSGVILVDSSSFANYSQPNPGVASVKVEHYTRDSESGEYSKVLTETAKFKEGQTWRASQNIAILFDHNFDKVESTAAGNATYGSVTAGASITVKYYYTRYIKSGYLTVSFLNTVDGARVKTPMKYRLRDGDPFSIPYTAVQAYELDTTKYPANTIGTFDADAPASFTFYYKKLANETTRVHFYKPTSRFAGVNGTILCYAYDDNGIEALGAWALQTKGTAGLKKKDPTGDGWEYIDIPTTACYVMFHYTNGDINVQVPDQGEPGYPVCGEAWIKDGVVTFNNKIVTSHIEMSTGQQIADDVEKSNENVGTNQTYTTSPLRKVNRDYVSPANASGFFEAGVSNVVYLYGPEKEIPVVPGEGTLLGDADKDDRVTIIDATIIQLVLAGKQPVTAYDSVAANVDDDNKVTILDVTAIQRWLAGLAPEDSKINTRVIAGDDPIGKYTYEEFVDLFNSLVAKLAKYPAKTYGKDPYYQAADAAANTYRSITLNPSATVEEIDTAYEAVRAAYDGMENIEIIEEPEPERRESFLLTDNFGWGAAYVYAWDESGTPIYGEWPGAAQAETIVNQYGETQFRCYIPENAAGVILNNGSGGQTEDITDFTYDGYWMDGTQNEKGHYLVIGWRYDENENPPDDPYDPGDPYTPEEPPVVTGSKMYMIPSSEWKQSGARFAAYFFEDEYTHTWLNMKYAGEDLYSVDIPEGYSYVIFCRMSGTSGVNDWSNKWNQTEDIPVEANSTYTVVGWGKTD